MKLSVVMASYNRGPLLDRVLTSIYMQNPPFDYEVIVADDGSTDNTAAVCERHGVTRLYLHRPYYCNPAAARNMGYRAARGEVIVAQSSDTFHRSPDALERLADIAPGTFNIATVMALRKDGSVEQEYTGVTNQRPLFFLGSLRREDLYAIGGDDEDFTVLGCEDDWFADRLLHGRKLVPVYRQDVVGVHQWHERPAAHWEGQFEKAKAILAGKRDAARNNPDNWRTADAPWPLESPCVSASA